jgi:hypothetical protein
MSGMPEDVERERRIEDEVVVDAYGEEERALGWYYYLESQLRFPFVATCVEHRMTSPLHVGDEVEVKGMAEEAVCEHDMLVLIRWERPGLAVPLAQLRPVGRVDEASRQAVEDWLYWVARGYEF